MTVVACLIAFEEILLPSGAHLRLRLNRQGGSGGLNGGLENRNGGLGREFEEGRGSIAGGEGGIGGLIGSFGRGGQSGIGGMVGQRARRGHLQGLSGGVSGSFNGGSNEVGSENQGERALIGGLEDIRRY
ncbi:hypothetical protein MRX96_047941 [Rhipicephalus microplus]